MKKVLIGVLVTFLSFSVLARELTENERVVVEGVVREEMKDPDAAKFFHGDFPQTEKNNLYCGYVNGKNSYGAYTGKKLFAVLMLKKDNGETAAMSMNRNRVEDKPLSQEIIAASCAGAGYPIKINKIFVNNVNKSRKANNLPPIDNSLVNK